MTVTKLTSITSLTSSAPIVSSKLVDATPSISSITSKSSTPADLAARMAEKVHEKPDPLLIILDPDALKKPRRRAAKSVPMTAQIAARAKALHRDTDMIQSEIAAVLKVNQGRISDVLRGKIYADVPPSYS